MKIDKIRMLYGNRIKRDYEYGVLLENKNKHILIDETGKKHIIDKAYYMHKIYRKHFVATSGFGKGIIVDMENGGEIDSISNINILYDYIVVSNSTDILILNHSLDILWKQRTVGCIQSISISKNTEDTLFIDAVVEIEYSDKHLYIEYMKHTNKVYSRWKDSNEHR